MGKTLMDGKSKEQRPSQSESFESFRGPLLIKMQNRNKPADMLKVKKEHQSPEPESIEEEVDTSQQSDLLYEQRQRNITPSAPPRLHSPDNELQKMDAHDKLSQAMESHLTKPLSAEPTNSPQRRKPNERDSLLRKNHNSGNNNNNNNSTRGPTDAPETTLGFSTSNKMTSFENDPEGFMEELEISQATDWMTSMLTILSMIVVVLTFPFSMFFCLKIVAEYERAVVLRMGRLLPNGKGTKGPGLFFILPCIDSVRTVELRTVTFSIPPQEVLTKDSVTVAVDAVVYYRICNPAVSFLNVEDAARSTRLLAQTTLRNVLGTKDLAQILMDREEMSVTMQSTLDGATEAWGVKVERVEIKDVRLPVALQRAMAAEAEATREARARVIAATGEHKASKALKEAALVISSSPLALQLRYLQTMCAISAEKNSTIIFPLPIDILQGGGGGPGIASSLDKTGGFMRRNELKHALVKKWLPSIPDYTEGTDLSPEHRQATTVAGIKKHPEERQQQTKVPIAGSRMVSSRAVISDGGKPEFTQRQQQQVELFSSLPDEEFDTYSDSV